MSKPFSATSLAALLLAAALPSDAQEKTFRMGPVDLLSLAAATPTRGTSPTTGAPATPTGGTGHS